MRGKKINVMFAKNADKGTYSDGDGLYLIKSSKDSGKWVYKYSFLKKRKTMGLGPWPSVVISEARETRDQWAKVLRVGSDPITQRNIDLSETEKEMNKLDPTFEEWANDVFEAKKAGLRGDGNNGRWFSPIRIYMIPNLGKRRMSEIHQSEIRDALKAIWRKKHPTAEKALQRTYIIFRQGRLTGLECNEFTVDAAKHLLGEYRHKKIPLKSMPWQDVPEFYARIGNTLSSHRALKFIILTAVRSASGRGAEYAEINNNVWTVPEIRMKGKEGQTSNFRVPLSQEAINIIQACKDDGSQKYLFEGYKSKCVTEAAIRKLLKEMGADCTLHGFRASFKTWIQDTEAASYDVGETALAHIIGNEVERSYARSDLLEKRAVLMEKWANFVTGKTQGNVINITG